MPVTPTCPLCTRGASRDYAPFCSRTCRDRDLLRWLGDGYRMPGPAADDAVAPNDGLDSPGSPD